jgi:hypothetical protein
MGIFKKQTDETALAAMRARSGVLEGKRATAQSALDELLAKRQRFLLEADLDSSERDFERIEKDILAGTSRVSGLVDALNELSARIGTAEAELAAKNAAIERAEAAARLNVHIGAFEMQLPVTLEAMRALADACSPLASISFEIAQVKEYIAKMAGEIEIAGGFILPDVRLQATMVASGERAVPRQPAEVIELRPAEPVVTVTDPAEPTVQVFATAPLRWKDKAGNKHFAERWTDCDLPVRLQARASQRGVIVGMDDPRRRTHRGLLGSFTPPESAICDLDAELLPPATDLPEGFERLPTGPARTLVHVEPRR